MRSNPIRYIFFQKLFKLLPSHFHSTQLAFWKLSTHFIAHELAPSNFRTSDVNLVSRLKRRHQRHYLTKFGLHRNQLPINNYFQLGLLPPLKISHKLYKMHTTDMVQKLAHRLCRFEKETEIWLIKLPSKCNLHSESAVSWYRLFAFGHTLYLYSLEFLLSLLLL